MKLSRLLILPLLALLMFSFGPAFGQAMHKKVIGTTQPWIPDDGFVNTNKADLDTIITYEAATNILFGPGYTEDGFGAYFGLAFPVLSGYIVGMGKYGEITGNPEIDLTARAFYPLTAGTSALNAGLLLGLGPLFEKVQSGTAGVYDWVTQFSVAGGGALTYTLSTKLGVVGGYEYQVAGEKLGDKAIHRGFIGFNYLL